MQITATDKTGVILLAAGESSRLGKPKQLLSFKGSTLLQHATQVAIDSGNSPIIVVLGAGASELRNTLKEYDVQIVENFNWQAGMASSINAGLVKLKALCPDIAGAIIMVCDQPYVSPHLLRKMKIAWLKGGKGIVACAYGDTTGTPALFAKDYFEDLKNLHGQEGAKKILKAYQSFIVLVHFPLGQIDIDTQEDYNSLDPSQQKF